jgi:hypothetical protein
MRFNITLVVSGTDNVIVSPLNKGCRDDPGGSAMAHVRLLRSDRKGGLPARTGNFILHVPLRICGGTER